MSPFQLSSACAHGEKLNKRKLGAGLIIATVYDFSVYPCSGADPGFRRGGGVRTFRRGGEGVRTGISGADPNCCRALGKSTSKKKLQTAVGGGGVRSPKKKPVSAHAALCSLLTMVFQDKIENSLRFMPCRSISHTIVRKRYR